MTAAVAPAQCPGAGQYVPVKQFIDQPCPECGRKLQPLLSWRFGKHRPRGQKEEREPMTSVTIEAAGRVVETSLDGLAEAARIVTERSRTRDSRADERCPVPMVSGAFMRAPDLEPVVADLIERHPETFGHLNEFTVRVLWKAKAGSKNGRVVIGKCQRPRKTSLLGFYEPADFVIWLAADYIRGAGFTRRQVEAALFHELSHTSIDENGGAALVPHQFEGFRREIELYGYWDESLQVVKRAVQARMRFEETGEIADDDEGDDAD